VTPNVAADVHQFPCHPEPEITILSPRVTVPHKHPLLPLTDSADQLAKLWDKDAVRFPASGPAEIGAAAIYADDKRWETSSGRERSLCYDMEVQDIQLAGDWAFEWGYASWKSAKSNKVSIEYAEVLRVMKRQADGTWRFARVIGVTSPSVSSVVLKHPCQ